MDMDVTAGAHTRHENQAHSHTFSFARLLLSAAWLVTALLAAGSAAQARTSQATQTANWPASFNAAPSCGGSCHSMAARSFAPANQRVPSTANSASVAVQGTNGNYYWRYRQGSQASSVFSSAQQVGSLATGVNNIDFCVVEVTEPGDGARHWNCGEFQISKNRLPSVSLNRSSVALEVGESENITVTATDDLPGLTYSASSNAPAVQVDGNGPVFTIRANSKGSARVRFTVTDADGESSYRDLTATVSDVPVQNQPPQIDSISPNTPTVDINETIDIRVNARDDKAGLRYSADANSAGVTVSGNGPVFSLRGNAAGSADIEFTVTDSDGASVSRFVTASVNRANGGGTTGTTTGGNGSGECVDTDPVGDGWGWNGTSSCRVDSGGGTGGDTGSTGGESGGTCVDTDPVGDGWGWDGTSSCRVGVGGGTEGGTGGGSGDTCVDTDPVGDGWGWDGSSSCRVGGGTGGDTGGTGGGSGNTCVDTDPVGDGWGWDGSSSCRVDAGGGTGGGTGGGSGDTCVDTDPVGDGWGWDGSSSCRVGGGGGGDTGGAGEANCVDTDPVGDGWGWNGTSSCRVEAESGYAGRSNDGQWPVCYAGIGLGSSEAWQVQTGVETGVAEPCVKQCPDDYIRDTDFPGWGWNQQLATSCVETSTPAGSNTAVPVYVNGQRLTFANSTSRNGLVRGGSSWSCQLQTRPLASEPFVNNGQTMTLQFSNDGSLTASGQSSATWSLSGRLLRLQTIPAQIYRNVQFDGGRLHLYSTTEVRYDCR